MKPTRAVALIVPMLLLAGCAGGGDSQSGPQVDFTITGAGALDINCQSNDNDRFCHVFNVTLTNLDEENRLEVNKGLTSNWEALTPEGYLSESPGVVAGPDIVRPNASADLRLAFNIRPDAKVDTLSYTPLAGESVTKLSPAYEIQTYEPRVELNVTDAKYTANTTCSSQSTEPCHYLWVEVTNHRDEALDWGGFDAEEHWHATTQEGTRVKVHDIDGYDKEELNQGDSDEVRLEFPMDGGELAEIHYEADPMPKPATASIPSYR